VARVAASSAALVELLAPLESFDAKSAASQLDAIRNGLPAMGSQVVAALRTRTAEARRPPSPFAPAKKIPELVPQPHRLGDRGLGRYQDWQP
jgi:hypothetical protein